MRLTKNEKAALREILFEMTKPHTQEEIADHLGVSRRTVNRIEEGAMAKLRTLAVEDWKDGLEEPTALQTKMYEIGPSDGRTSPSDYKLR
jgi:DNA-binding XRE family transcriptional regulator